MILNKENILNIFQKNNLGKIIKSDFGKAIETDNYNAFLLSCLTETGYVTNKSYGLNFYGLLKVFNSAYKYSLIAGIYNNQGNIEFKFNPNNIIKKYPFIIEGKKKIILPVEFENEKEFREILAKIYENDQNHFDYLILRIDTSKKGYGLENLLEYFCSEFFKSKNFLTETQVPISHGSGVPDLCAFSNIISEKGINIIELSMITAFKKEFNLAKKNIIFQNNVGEAKALSSIDVTKRLKKYLNTNLFDKSFTLYPDDKKVSFYRKEKKNLFYINENYDFSYLDLDIKVSSDKTIKNEYRKWFMNYLKFYLFSNLSNDQLKSFLDINKIRYNDIKKFIEKICQIDIDNLVNDYIR